VGKTFCYSGIGLSLLCIAADALWSPLLVVYADLLLLLGSLLSLIWTRNEGPYPYFCWWPLYVGFWVSMWPSLWATGGAHSPLLGIFLALLYLFGVIVQARIRHLYIIAFVLLHIPVIFSLDRWFPFSAQPLPPSNLIAAMHALGSLALGICIYSLLNTERRLSEQFSIRYRELSKAKQDLRKEEASNFAKTTFLANVSHELRTPLGAILGYAELLSYAGPSRERQIAYLDILKRNGQQLSRIVDDLLDLSRMEAGTVEIEKVSVKVGDVLTDVLELHTFNAEKKGLPLRVEYATPVPEFVVSDPTRLRQILGNLVSNAVKFTDRGEVKIRVEYELQEKGGRLNFSVSDTGRGIAEQEQQRLFKPFSQGDPTLSKRYGGTGLGLSLSRKLASILGGGLDLTRTETGRGSVFTFYIPVDEARAVSWKKNFEPSAPHKEKPIGIGKDRLAGTRILCVDDTLDNRQLVQVYLNSVGAEVDMASDGREGVEKALANNYDLILMDVQMPLMDGYEAVATLRQSGYTKPILALTAHAMREDGEQCLAVGCNGHLSKPITCADLVRAIEKTLRAGQNPRLHATL
jgi:signal transduction histidine kinase/ActR/RegA family two-component response regulator